MPLLMFPLKRSIIACSTAILFSGARLLTILSLQARIEPENGKWKMENGKWKMENGKLFWNQFVIMSN